MGKNNYASVAQRVDTTNQDNKYRTLMGKLIYMEPNDWPNFQEQLRKSYLATQEESKRPETDNVGKTENRPDIPTKASHQITALLK